MPPSRAPRSGGTARRRFDLILDPRQSQLMPDVDAEVAIVGAGVVGLAVAAELAREHSVVVIERHDGPARESSSHNSQVVHAGLFYAAGSLKHRLCLEGNRLLYEWCGAHHVTVRRSRQADRRRRRGRGRRARPDPGACPRQRCPRCHPADRHAGALAGARGPDRGGAVVGEHRGRRRVRLRALAGGGCAGGRRAVRLPATRYAAPGARAGVSGLSCAAPTAPAPS